jgi:peptide/nickel transport system substrate-binding protein
MKAGKVDISRVDSLQVKGLEGDSNVQVDYFNIPNYVFVAPNNNLKIFQDTKVRQALAYGLDRKAIMDIMVQGRGVLAAGPISPAYADFYNPNVKPYPFDPEKARALLREAGWTDSDGDGVLEKDLGDGRRTPLRFKQTHFQGRVDWEGFAAVVQDNWKKIGVQVLSDAVEFGQLQTARVIPRAYEVILNSWVTRPDPDMFNYFHSSTAMAGANYGVWRNKEADDLIESGQAERDPRKRKAIYWKLQEVCNREQPVIFTHHYQDIMATSKRTRGYLPASFLVNRFWSHKWWVTQ